jgi:Leucine-rich repeat (LRR) protein
MFLCYNLISAIFGLIICQQILKIEGHALQSLAASSVPTPAVETFSLTNGPLSDIAADTFAICKKIKTLDLHGNALTELKRGVFKGLRDLESLDLSHNQLLKVT